MGEITGQESEESPNASKMIRQIQEFMKMWEGMLEEGAEPDLTGLDVKVESLCKTIASQDANEYDRMRPKLDSLIESLTHLGSRLQEQRDSLGQKLGALQQQKMALNAYQRASASGEASKAKPQKDTK